jgi:hypothetical protein
MAIGELEHRVDRDVETVLVVAETGSDAEPSISAFVEAAFLWGFRQAANVGNR